MDDIPSIFLELTDDRFSKTKTVARNATAVSHNQKRRVHTPWSV